MYVHLYRQTPVAISSGNRDGQWRNS